MQVIARPRPFDIPQDVRVDPGQTLESIVRTVYERAGIRDAHLLERAAPIVQVNGDPVPRAYWRYVKPKEGANVVVTTPVHGSGGGKDPVATLLTIAVLVAAPYAAPLLGVTGTFAAAVTTGLVATAGVMLVNALFPIRIQSGADHRRDSPTYSIHGARNDVRRFGVVPVVLGTHRHYPPLGSASYTELLGEDEYLNMFLVWGYGPLQIENLRIRDTPISSYQGVSVTTRQGFETDSVPKDFPAIVRQEHIGATLDGEGFGFPEIMPGPWTTRTTHADTDEFSFDIICPAGLGRYTDKGKFVPFKVTIEWQYRPVGGAWSSTQTVEIERKSTSAVRYGVRWPPRILQFVPFVGNILVKQFALERGAYEVRWRRNTWVFDEEKTIALTMIPSLRSFTNDHPIQFNRQLAYSIIRIKATDQLSGVVDTINADVSSLVPVWTGSSWQGTNQAQWQVSSNPAALYRHVLMGPGSAEPRTAAQVDSDALAQWYSFCDTHGYKLDMVRDFQASVWETLSDIASAGRASPDITGGKWSVIVDDANRPVRQHFTPRNSWGFETIKATPVMPHAWRVKFKNREIGYEDDEMVVYDDGYTSANATRFERIEFPGLVEPELNWRFGRYHIAQARLRPEEHSFYADFEHLACKRGDLVLVQHHVTLWGNGSARVKAVLHNDDGIYGVVVDEMFAVEQGVSYNMRFRLQHGTSLTVPVSAEAGIRDAFLFSSPIPIGGEPPPDVDGTYAFDIEVRRQADHVVIDSATGLDAPYYDMDGLVPETDYAWRVRSDLEGTKGGWSNWEAFTTTLSPALDINPNVGDLVMFGAVGMESNRLLVKTIERSAGPGLVARITCVEEAPQIYEADTGPVPPHDPRITQPIDLTTIPPPVPSIVGIESGASALLPTGTGFVPRALVTVQPGEGRVPVREWHVRYRDIDGGDWTVVQSPADQMTIALMPVETGETYHIQARAISVWGEPSPWSILATQTVLGEDEPPGNVDGFVVNVVGDTAHLSWDRVQGIHISHYRLKWSPEKQGATWNTAVDVAPVVQGLSITLPAQVGTYLIKAVTFSGIESNTSAAAITSVAKLFGLNIVEFIEKASPTWPGTKERVIYDAGVAAIVLDYENGNLYEDGYYYVEQVIDLQTPFTTRISGSVTAYGADLALDLYDYADLYEVDNLYGAQDGSFTVGIEVRTTDDDPAGTPTWTDWHPLIVGDVTARAYSFRIRLQGDGGTVTPVMSGAYLEVDMEDRIYRFHAVVPTIGARVDFDPPFYAFTDKRGLGISVLNGQEGDRYTVTNLDETGFDIAFTNGGNAVEREISGVAQSYGERIS